MEHSYPWGGNVPEVEITVKHPDTQLITLFISGVMIFCNLANSTIKLHKE